MSLWFLADGCQQLYISDEHYNKRYIYTNVLCTKHVILIKMHMYVHQQSVIFMSCSVPAYLQAAILWSRRAVSVVSMVSRWE